MTEKDIKGLSLAQVKRDLAQYHHKKCQSHGTRQNTFLVDSDTSSNDKLENNNDVNQNQGIKTITDRNRGTTVGISEDTLPTVFHTV